MIDVKFIRKCPEVFDLAMRRRNEPVMSASIIEVDTELRKRKGILQELLTERNSIATQIGHIKDTGQDMTNLKQRAEQIKQEIPKIEIFINELEVQLEEMLLRVPNILADDIPDGSSEQDNVVLRQYGTARTMNFTPKQHFELGEGLGQMNFEQAVKISGSRFVILKRDLARLERALANFMLDLHVNYFGYTEILPPYLVLESAMIGTGQLPKFADDSFLTTDGLRLIPTAEVPLTNLVAGQVIAEESLPLRFTAYSPCFRSEVGSAGKDTRGMLRQHQFTKVELVSITRPQDAPSELERMTAAAEEVLKRLELPYRVVLLCTRNTGFSACKTYDLEVWLPGQNCYREISSCSHCGDFQARRIKICYKEYSTKRNYYAHTMNGSALAIGRTIIAIMENFQNEDGSINIPEALMSFFGKKAIEIEKI